MLDYRKTNKYWNSVSKEKEIGRYSFGYIMPVEFEDVAHYRFKKEINFLNEFIELGGNYLDIGCGAGNFLYNWHNDFDLLVGIDFSEVMINTCRKNCKSFKNVRIFQGNVLDFEEYIEKDLRFKFIFIGGCLMYLSDVDASNLLLKLCQRLDTDGVLVFRESTAKKNRTYDNTEKYACIRRTVQEYKQLLSINKESYLMDCCQNYYVNYTYFICLYLKLFPFLKNKIMIFNNVIIEYFFLYLPLKVYSKLKNNMILNHFFIIKNK